MKGIIKHINAIETGAGEIFRSGDYITVQNGDEYTGRLDYVGNEYFTVDASVAFRANTFNFEYDKVDGIKRAEPPPVNGYPVHFFQCKTLLSPIDAEKLRARLLEQIAEGVVELPQGIQHVKTVQGHGVTPHIEFIEEGADHDHN